MKTDSLIELTYRSYFSISCELTAIFCWWVDQSGWSIVIVHLEIRKWWIDFLRIDGSSRIFHTGFISKWMDETEWEKSVGKFQLATANGRLKESQKERKREPVEEIQVEQEIEAEEFGTGWIRNRISVTAILIDERFSSAMVSLLTIESPLATSQFLHFIPFHGLKIIQVPMWNRSWVGQRPIGWYAQSGRIEMITSGWFDRLTHSMWSGMGQAQRPRVHARPNIKIIWNA